MHRFFVPPTELRSTRIQLPEAEARHAAQVLRVRSGETVQVLDGAGRRYDCVVDSVERRDVWLSVAQTHEVAKPSVSVEVYPAVAKGKAMDLIIQKAVELGAAKICPVICDHSVAQYDDERGESKAEKWQAAAIEAVKQCGREWLPEVRPPQAFADALNSASDKAMSFVAALQSGAAPLGRHMADYVASHGSLPTSVGLWVGPEGDYSAGEYAGFSKHGVLPVTLGSHVLRCETALLAMLAICQHEIEMRSLD